MPFGKLKVAAQKLQARRACFDGQGFDQALFDQIMAKPEPHHTYAIFFTPRSGSTRVTQLLQDAGVSNAPREFFNDRSMQRFARQHSARSFAEYLPLLRRNQQVAGHFGFEITYRQILFVFFSSARFMQMMRPDHTAWLIREDVVAQAVSGSRLQQTQVPHAPRATADGHAKAEAMFTYRADQITNVVKTVVRQEKRMQKMFARFALSPFRLSYEMTNAMGPDQAVNLLAKGLGLPEPTEKVPNTHHKLAGEKGAAFAERFKTENSAFLADVKRIRAPLLKDLHTYADRNF